MMKYFASAWIKLTITYELCSLPTPNLLVAGECSLPILKSIDVSFKFGKSMNDYYILILSEGFKCKLLRTLI